MKVKAVGAYSIRQPFELVDIIRCKPGPHDVKIEIAYYGVCHPDIHRVRSEWAGTVYPCVLSHEIVGRVAAVGDQIRKYTPGDPAGVGCIADGCKHCEECEGGLENYCDYTTGTYNSPTPDGLGRTPSGYSQQIAVHEWHVLRVRHPQEQLAAVAPLLCTGITTYSSLRHWLAGLSRKVGVVGIGDLRRMGAGLAHAMGAHMVVFTTSGSKREVVKVLGAGEVVNSYSTDEMVTHVKNFNPILNTVAVSYNLGDFTTPLKCDGTITLVGTPTTPRKSPEVFNLIMECRAVAGSIVGGIPETQEMLDSCAEHDTVADIETVRVDQINEAYERMLRGDVKYRSAINNHALAD